jgi:phosphodiesterase/alkaline phosphatase D-like protein
MSRLLPKLAMAAIVAISLFPNPTVAQLISPAKRAGRVVITHGPELESAWANWVIVTWTSNNPGGSDEHWGVVHYGTDPKDLNRIARSPIRLNQNHSYTVFRVRVLGLTPRTTYYYTVDSMEGDGTSDGVKSPVNRFSTARTGERNASD